MTTVKGFETDVLCVSFRQSEWRTANARNVSFETLCGGQFTLSTQLTRPINLSMEVVVFKSVKFTTFLKQLCIYVPLRGAHCSNLYRPDQCPRKTSCNSCITPWTSKWIRREDQVGEFGVVNKLCYKISLRGCLFIYQWRIFVEIIEFSGETEDGPVVANRV